MAKTYSSPGTYITEKEIQYTAETVGVTTLGLVGETQKGPAFQPFFIKNYTELKTYFGGLNPEKFKNTQILKYELPYIAKSYLSQSNQLFVTRILGLSGYNAGNAFVLRTIGAVDFDTISTSTVDSGTTIDFYIDNSGVFRAVSDSSLLIDGIASDTGIEKTYYDTTFATFFNATNMATKDWYNDKVMYWGYLSDANKTIIDGLFTNTGNTSSDYFVDAYELPASVDTDDQLNHFMYNHMSYSSLNDNYTGDAFAVFVDNSTIGSTVLSGDTYTTGTLTIAKFTHTADPIAEMHKMAIATLRSRGTYSSDVLDYSVVTDLVIDTTSFAAETDPFASFTLTGTTETSVEFEYTVSLDSDSKDYVKSVLGVNNQDKSSYIFVEEVYSNVLTEGFNAGKIKGIHPQLLTVSNWNHKKVQYQTPITPYIVSELRGGLPERLFRFVAISDGENANSEVKVSIAAIDLSKKIFDVEVRSYNDTDRSVNILEKYFNCSMDDSSDDFIGRKIGTIDGMYEIKSSYVTVQLADNYPNDAVPAGFEGYPMHSTANALVPAIPYKTKYYTAGETVYDPPFSAPVISTGDKLRYNYLGFSDTIGYDTDLLKFKGWYDANGNANYNVGDVWTTLTKGFHMDSNSASIVNDDNETVFSAGNGTFISASEISADTAHAYYDIKSRKFTVLLAGGFDGWDMYRDSRTNLDSYRIGQTAFVDGGFDTYLNTEYDETFGTSDYYAYLNAYKAMQNPEEISINLLSTPGIDILNNTALTNEVIEIVDEKRKDCVYLPTLPDIKLLNNVNASNTEDWYFPKDVVSEYESTSINSNSVALYYPWILINDTENNVSLYVPPTGEVVKNFAYTDNTAFVWYATAGYNRGVVNAKKLRIPITEDSRNTLYTGKINPLTKFSDAGILIFGNRNTQLANGPLASINVRRLFYHAKKLITAVSNRLLFDPDDDRIRSEFISQVNPILDNIRKERGLTDFRVVLSNDVADKDQSILRGKIYLKPIKALEYIELEFTATPQGVSFDSL